MKIRIKFRRWGSMKYLGHLDMMRYFQRAIRRAEINICYSEGFSPHPIMSFAAPLGVGITSDGEYFDIEVHDSFSSSQAIERLNNTMVDGIAVTGYVKLPDNAKTAMSLVAAADYVLSWKEGYQSPFTLSQWQDKLQEYFLSKEEFLITKKTAKSEKVLDLKQLVYHIAVEGEEDAPVFRMQICTGSTNNIKPELVLSSLYEVMELPFDAIAIQIHRTEVYAVSENGFVSLLDMGEQV